MVQSSMKCTNLLSKILVNRELRQEKQWELIDSYDSPILSLSINIPGTKKDSDDAKYIYESALKEIDKLGLKQLDSVFTCKDTGYEALFCLHVDAQELKTFTCKIEEDHMLGRFMDMDVLDEHKQILSRENPRKCFICNKPAKECARMQTHSIDELLSYISKTVHDYKSRL